MVEKVWKKYQRSYYFERNWPHTCRIVDFFTFGHFFLNLESEIFCCFCDGSQSPDANIGCNDVSQSKSHKTFVLVHDHLNNSAMRKEKKLCIPQK